MKFPIIFVNYGNPWYLKYSLSQCIGTNPNARVILIGDKSNYGYKGVEHHFAEDYLEYVNQFSNVYEHLSSNSYRFELICFQRWFILYDFINKNGINEFFTLDSDVLLFDEIEKYKTRIADKKINLFINKKGYSACAHSSFFLSKEILLSFLEFVLNIYRNKISTEFKELVNHYHQLKETGKNGGVCDMNLLYQFSILHSDQIYDSCMPLTDNCYIDDNVSSRNSPYFTFEHDGSLKKIIWKNKIPIIKVIEPKELLLKTISLHFQGASKSHMPKHITYKGYYYWYNCHWIEFKNKVKQILKFA